MIQDLSGTSHHKGLLLPFYIPAIETGNVGQEEKGGKKKNVIKMDFNTSETLVARPCCYDTAAVAAASAAATAAPTVDSNKK